MIYIITLIVILFIGIFLYKRDPNEKIKREIQKKLAQATEYQRNGKLREYAEIIQHANFLKQYAECNEIYTEIEQFTLQP
jgi:hypothetical protein